MLKLIERIVYCIRRGNLGTRIGISALVDGVLFGPSFHGLCGSLLKKKFMRKSTSEKKESKGRQGIHTEGRAKWLDQSELPTAEAHLSSHEIIASRSVPIR
jgi:hypothetical protein